MKDVQSIREISTRLEEIDREFKSLTEEKETLTSAMEELRSQDPVFNLAIDIHNQTCTADHTEYCGWYYEIKNGKHDWNGSTHNTYLARAQQIIDAAQSKNYSIEDIDNFIGFLHGDAR